MGWHDAGVRQMDQNECRFRPVHVALHPASVLIAIASWLKAVPGPSGGNALGSTSTSVAFGFGSSTLQGQLPGVSTPRGAITSIIVRRWTLSPVWCNSLGVVAVYPIAIARSIRSRSPGMTTNRG